MKREARNHHATAVRHRAPSPHLHAPAAADHAATPAKCHRPLCSLCRRHPASKSRDKIKGARKLRSCDVSVDPRLLSWRVVDAGDDPGGFASCVGASATGVLGYLEGYRFDDLYDDYDGGGEETVIEMDAVDEIAEIGFFCVGVLWDCMDEDDDWCLVGQA